MMEPNADITRGIARAAAGPKVGAFFDADRTLLAGYSAMAFLQDGIRSGRYSLGRLLQSTGAALRFGAHQTSFPTLIEETSSEFAGLTAEELAEIGERVFAERLMNEIFPESRALVRAHKRRGHTVAIISSATHFQIDALARELEIEHVLCTELQMKDGRFTGKVVRPACFRKGKLLAARKIANEEGVDLDQSFFYTDSYDDISLLEGVGNPRLINPDGKLAEVATRKGWPVLHFASRGLPGARDLVRFGLSVGAMAPAAAVGAPMALATGSLRKGMDSWLSTWSDLGTALSGVDIEVEGEENLWVERPAVFLFNHQSGIDPMLLAKLLRRDVVGVAKAELAENPFLGPIFKAAGTVFVERGGSKDAAASMKPAVEALRRGRSIVIAPEGTRSGSPRLGSFKKGGFHAAMQAGVPIVPIVLRNAGDALANKAVVMRPAKVQVVVHPPIHTDDWTVETLDDRVAEVHRLYQETLDR